MVKAPSTSTKFKPWRRGVNKKSKGSLKHQLRGQERLLLKATTDEQRQAIQGRIDDLKQQHAAKQEQERERLNAKKSHGTRFLERQKLTRLLRKERDEESRLPLTLDLVYVAHFPLDVSYMKLFRHGQRVVDMSNKVLAKRAKIRDRIFRNLTSEQASRVDWITPEQYRTVPSCWTVEQERSVFGQDSTSNASVSDKRFEQGAFSESHERLLQAAEDVEEQIDVEDLRPAPSSLCQRGLSEYKAGESRRRRKSHSGSISEDDEDEEEIDNEHDGVEDSEIGAAKIPSGENVCMRSDGAHESDDEEGSNESDSSKSIGSIYGSSSDDGDDNDNDNDRDDPEGLTEHQATLNPNADADTDDFLIEADSGDDVFGKASIIPSIDRVRGDKSQGWATQRQRPGQFQRKKRRY